MQTFFHIIQKHLNNNVSPPREKLDLYAAMHDLCDLTTDFSEKDAFQRSIAFWKHLRINNTTVSAVDILFFTYITELTSDCRVNNISKINVHKKFEYWKHLIENTFLSEMQREYASIIFSKIQQTYYAFSKLAFIFKFKRAKTVITTDLYLNEIDIDKSNIIIVYQSNTKYLFIMNDLIKIINTNLSNSPYFFAEPKVSKNPYNNIVFDTSTLYNIYFFIQHKRMIIPGLFHKYFIANFNLLLFLRDNECYILDEAIKNHVYSSNYELLYPKVMTLIHKHLPIIRVHKEFPKEQLVNIMKPYLHLYYTSLYAIHGTSKKHDAYTILRKKCIKFETFNPFFGRKKGNVVKSWYMDGEGRFRKKRAMSTSFNDEHIPFYRDNVHMTSISVSTTNNMISIFQQNIARNHNHNLNMFTDEESDSSIIADSSDSDIDMD